MDHNILKEQRGIFMKEQEREVENNIYFWQKLDTLILSSQLVIDQPKGSAHPQYPRLVYPVDRGVLKDTYSAQGIPIYVYRGSLPSKKANAIIVQADILHRECVTKPLIGCTEEECAMILKFINSTDFQKAILVRRSSSAPDWASTDA